MPHVSVKCYPGRTEEQKQALAKAITENVKEIGSDYIVVGRPITKAEDPVAAYRRCVKEFIG